MGRFNLYTVVASAPAYRVRQALSLSQRLLFGVEKICPRHHWHVRRDCHLTRPVLEAHLNDRLGRGTGKDHPGVRDRFREFDILAEEAVSRKNYVNRIFPAYPDYVVSEGIVSGQSGRKKKDKAISHFKVAARAIVVEEN